MLLLRPMSDLFGSIAIGLAVRLWQGIPERSFLAFLVRAVIRLPAATHLPRRKLFADTPLAGFLRVQGPHDTGIRFFANDYSRFATAAPDEVETGNAVTLESA